MVNSRILVAIAAMGTLGLSLPSFASHNGSCPTGCPGIYVGAQLGWGNVDYKNASAFFDTDVASEDGLAGRVYLGYQFNQYLGLETGFAAFSTQDIPADLGKIKTTQWDLLARVGMPFGDSGFRGDVKLGAAYVFADYETSANAVVAGFSDVSSDEIKPIAGASLTYNFCSNVSVDLSYLHGFGHSNSNNFDDHWAPNTDLVTLGVSYLFPTM
jgi:OmpA-like transmembrane domain